MFVSGLDQKLPAAMAKVNKHKVPSNAVWVQTVIAALFALVAFVVMPSFGIGGGQPIDIQTKVYDVLQAAVTVIWCISMVVLFVDVVIIIRRFLPRYQETRLARPAVFYTCAVVGGVSALVAVIATLSGSWTPLISNDSGEISIAGATIAYGAWFYLVAGIAALSLIVSVFIYWLGNGHVSACRPDLDPCHSGSDDAAHGRARVRIVSGARCPCGGAAGAGAVAGAARRGSSTAAAPRVPGGGPGRSRSLRLMPRGCRTGVCAGAAGGGRSRRLRAGGGPSPRCLSRGDTSPPDRPCPVSTYCVCALKSRSARAHEIVWDTQFDGLARVHRPDSRRPAG